MEITYIGHSCFKIKGKDISLVIDPYDSKIGYKLPKLSADIVLATHDHFDHHNFEGVSDTSLQISGPGEYEKQGVFIYGRQTFHDEEEGSSRGDNTIYLIDIDGFSILHLGDLGHDISKETLDRISSVDVLMIPTGGKYTIDSKIASKVISSIEPGYVVPMHYKTDDLKGFDDIEPLSKFLEEMGLTGDGVRKFDKLKLSSKSDIPEETEVIILLPNH